MRDDSASEGTWMREIAREGSKEDHQLVIVLELGEHSVQF